MSESPGPFLNFSSLDNSYYLVFFFFFFFLYSFSPGCAAPHASGTHPHPLYYTIHSKLIYVTFITLRQRQLGKTSACYTCGAANEKRLRLNSSGAISGSIMGNTTCTPAPLAECPHFFFFFFFFVQVTYIHVRVTSFIYTIMSLYSILSTYPSPLRFAILGSRRCLRTDLVLV